jgi:hypothetical protein
MVFCRVMGWKEEPEEVDAREGVCNNDTAIPQTAYRIEWPTLLPSRSDRRRSWTTRRAATTEKPPMDPRLMVNKRCVMRCISLNGQPREAVLT